MTDQQEHIEQYLRGKLSAEEQANFEERLKEDVVLQEQLDHHRQLLKGLEIGFNQELKAFLIDEESKIATAPNQKTKRIKSFYPLIGLAATVSLLMITYFSIRKDPFNSEALFAQYYEVYPNVEAPVSRSENVEDNPYAYYESGDYATALKLFTSMLASDPENAAVLFYSGMCRLELDQPKRSIQLFDQVINLHSDKYSRPALWYQSLAYLNEGNLEKAKGLLEKLIRTDDVYARKANDLLEQF